MKRNHIYFLTAMLMMAGCEEKPVSPDELARDKAKDFAEAYFNFDFKEAQEHVTPESAKWLAFAASNVTQREVDLYNQLEEKPTINVSNVDWTTDSTATVIVEVSKAVHKEVIGEESRIEDEAFYQLTVVEREDVYYVRMAGLPRSEKQSHD